jgi:hypothetical protein
MKDKYLSIKFKDKPIAIFETTEYKVKEFSLKLESSTYQERYDIISDLLDMIPLYDIKVNIEEIPRSLLLKEMIVKNIDIISQIREESKNRFKDKDVICSLCGVVMVSEKCTCW